MIGYLRGQFRSQDEESMILDVGGVGYELQCSSNTLSDASMRSSGGEVEVFVHTHMREDALVLFGFSTSLEKRMFLSLLKVNGVGPKMAIKILSGATLDQLANMIESSDVKGLSNLPKVGKKTAEQLILSLKGKLVLAPEEKKSAKGSAAQSPMMRFQGVRGEVLSALVNLGFRLPDAEKAVSELPEDIDLQQGVRRGLQALTSV